MKDKTTKKYVGVFIVATIFIYTLTAHKYNNLKAAYENAEKEKVEYCKRYNELKCKINEDSVAVNLLEKDYYELWEENQRFSSIFSEIENESGGHEILKKLWGKNQQRKIK